MSGVGMGAVGRGCKRKHSATPSPSPKHHAQPFHTMHHAEGMVERVNKRNAVGIKIGHFYRCKECTFECATRAACIAHARRKHTNELIGPCNYCGTYYAHSADSMKYHVNECAGGTTSSYDTDVSFLIIVHYMSPALQCKSNVQLGNSEQCMCIHSSFVIRLHQLLCTISSLYMCLL